MPHTESLTASIKRIATELGFDLAGVTDVRASEHAAFYREWLAHGRHGEMGYLARADAVERRLEPGTAWPELKSAVVVALNYYPGEGPEPGKGDGRGIIARYARGRDYHRALKKKLLTLLARIEAEVGQELPLARAYVDTGPVLERELARRAGLGWFGRSAMLINPKRGSYVFLGALLVELDLEPDVPFDQDHCGSCNACVQACPTGALLGRDATGAPVVDATRCISYLTIEQRGAIPVELRPLIGNRIFGCDICQEVCPWNGAKFVRLTAEPSFRDRGEGQAQAKAKVQEGPAPGLGVGMPGTDAPSLVQLMRMTWAQWDVWTRGSAIRRAGYAGLRRNVAVAIGNWLAETPHPPDDAIAALRDALNDDEPLVREHAAWALGRIGSAEARLRLSSRVLVETDSSALEELRAAPDS